MTQHLMPVEQALSRMLAMTPVVHATESLPLLEAMGHVLARDIYASVNVPPADNSAVDGYALRLADAGAPLPVSQRVAAGQAPGPLKPGTCARIFTGAEIPAGADLVVMQEAVRFTAFEDVVVPDDLVSGQNIRPAGQDIRQGDCVLQAGIRLDYRHLGLLASIGVAQVEVFRRVRVAILSTGDELVMPGQTLQPGQIYNSNRYLLQGFLQQMGAEVVSFAQVPDCYEMTLTALRQAAEQADLIISTGGVSVGEEDHVKPAVEALGHLSLWKLAMKPGKPVAFGQIGSSLFLGLPGNPVSTFVGAQVFVTPVLAKLSGQSSGDRLCLSGTVDFSATARIRQEYLRVQAEWVENHWRLSAFPNQNSGVLTSAIRCNALAVLPPDTHVAPGDRLTFWLYDDRHSPSPSHDL